MYKKIICKNGEVILMSDIGNIISKINDLNLIDLAGIDNELEEIKKQKKIILDNLNSYQKNIEAIKKLTYPFILVSVNMLFFSVVFNLFICLICSLLALIALTYCNLCNKVLTNEINSNKLLINFLNNYQDKKIKERNALEVKPTFALIREGQEFDITKPVGLSNGIKVLRAYYKYKNLVHKSLSKQNCTRETVANNFLTVFKDCEVDMNHRDMIIDEVYENFTKERVLSKK